MEKEFIPFELSLKMKQLGFDEPCFTFYNGKFIEFKIWDDNGATYPQINVDMDIGKCVSAPTFSQAINFLYICSNKQIDIELKGSDTHEERIRKIEQGCKDLWNLQNNKSNQ